MAEDRRMTEKDEKLLDHFREKYELYTSNEAYLDWLERAERAFRFYNGKQWTDDERQAFTANGMTPYVVNLIKPRLKNSLSSEIKTRTKIRYLSRSGREADTDTADHISKLGYYNQQKNNSSHKLTMINHYASICGLSWHEFDPESNRIVESVGDPFEFVPDMEDDTDDYSNQNCCFRHRWYTLEEAKHMFKGHDEYLEGLAAGHDGFAYSSGHNFGDPMANGERKFRRQVFTGQYADDSGRNVLIIECQYRKICKLFEIVLSENKRFYEFDKKTVAEIKKKHKDAIIIESQGYRVYSLFFTGEQILYHAPLEYQLNPVEGWFYYTPYVYEKELDTGVPVGVVEGAIDPQMMYNKTQSKLKWLMSSERVIYEHEALLNPKKLRSTVSHPQGLIGVKTGKVNSIKFEKHHVEIREHFQSLGVHDREIQHALGVYDEAMGVQTNASSGRAIESRQQGTHNNQVFPLDRFRNFKMQYAEKLRELLRLVYSEEVVVDIVDHNGKHQRIHLNEVMLDDKGNPKLDERGNPIVLRDMSVGEYDIFIDEVRDVSSAREEARGRLMEAWQQPAFQWMLQTDMLGALKLIDYPDAEEFVEEMKARQAANQPPQGLTGGDAVGENSMQGQGVMGAVARTGNGGGA